MITNLLPPIVLASVTLQKKQKYYSHLENNSQYLFKVPQKHYLRSEIKKIN